MPPLWFTLSLFLLLSIRIYRLNYWMNLRVNSSPWEFNDFMKSVSDFIRYSSGACWKMAGLLLLIIINITPCSCSRIVRVAFPSTVWHEIENFSANTFLHGVILWSLFLEEILCCLFPPSLNFSWTPQRTVGQFLPINWMKVDVFFHIVS